MKMDQWDFVTTSLEKKLVDCSTTTFVPLRFESVFVDAFMQLHQSGLQALLQEWFYTRIQHHVQNEVFAWFWQLCENPIVNSVDVMLTAFNQLSSVVDNYSLCGEIVCGCSSSRTTVLEVINAILFTDVPDTCTNAITKVYQQSLKAFAVSKSGEVDLNSTGGTDDSATVACCGCDQPSSECLCELLLDKFRLLNQYIQKVDSQHVLLQEVCVRATDLQLREHVETVCKDSFEKKHLGTVLEWLDSVLIAWLQFIWNSDVIKIYRDRLRHNLLEEFAVLMIGQLFSIIIEYPESLPVVQDLCECLVHVNMHARLVHSLRTAFETRLLHPGVKTEDIITAYISTIRVMKVIDATGSLMNAVCEPVQQYLRNREDTVRCIVFSLTDSANCELSEELTQGLMSSSDHADDVDAVTWDDWKPDSVHVDSKYASSSASSHSDIINMLVNIFGSRNVFVNEYFNLLADRILTQPGFQIEREIRYLELLKLRFGETLFQQGEIMVKDVSDSNRINALVREAKKKTNTESDTMPLDALILSVQFWPQLKEEKLELPLCMKTAMEDYCKAFEKVKVNRSLTWRPNLGLVDIEVELKGRTYNLQVSPLHATIVWHFQEKARWNLDELSQVMQVPAQALQRKITFWVSKSLIQEEQPGVYVLNEDSKDLLTDGSVPVDEDMDIQLTSGKNKKEEEEPVIWQYVLGMLRNFVSLPLDRISTMLKMFAMQGPGSDWTISDIRNLLHKKVQEQKLVFAGGAYRLAKE